MATVEKDIKELSDKIKKARIIIKKKSENLDDRITVADKLKYQRRNCPMLSLEKFEAIENDPGYSYVQVDNYYFVKGAKSYTYVRIIEDLSKMLDLNISVICKKPE